ADRSYFAACATNDRSASAARRPPKGVRVLGPNELVAAADDLEAEPLVELFRPVLVVGDEEDQVGAGRLRLPHRAPPDGRGVAMATMLFDCRDVLHLGHALREVEVAPGDDLAVHRDAEEPR